MTEPDAYDHETHKDDEEERWVGGGVRKDKIESWPEERVKPLYAPDTIEEVIQRYIDDRNPEASPIDNDVVTTLKALKNEFSGDDDRKDR